jgi:hypothetical protein
MNNERHRWNPANWCKTGSQFGELQLPLYRKQHSILRPIVGPAVFAYAPLLTAALLTTVDPRLHANRGNSDTEATHSKKDSSQAVNKTIESQFTASDYEAMKELLRKLLVNHDPSTIKKSLGNLVDEVQVKTYSTVDSRIK